MYEPSKLDLAQMIGEEVSRLRRERDQLKEINDRMAEDRLRLVDELEGWKDNAEDTLRMYDKLKAESTQLRKQVQDYHKSASEHTAKFDRKHERLIEAEERITAARKVLFDDAFEGHAQRYRALAHVLGLDPSEEGQR